MKIWINGESGLVETDDDVNVQELHDYLTQELAKQGLVICGFKLDDEDVFFDVASEIHAKQASEFTKCEVDCAGAEQVSWDILCELEDKPAVLSQEAIKITEELQTGKTKEAHERLVRFSNSVSYIINGIAGANGVLGLDFTKSLNAEEQERLGKVGTYLKDLETAVEEQDFTTVGDVLEFDVAPALGVLTTIITHMKGELFARNAGDQASSDALSDES